MARNGIKLETAYLAKVGILSALAFMLTFLKISLPIFPNFLDLEVSNFPAIIGALSMGPLAGIFIELIKNLLGVIFKPVGLGIGQLANFIFGVAYILPFLFIYRKLKGVIGFLAGAAVAVVFTTFIACLVNYFFLIPVYASIFGKDIDYFVSITAEVNKLVKDFRGLIVFAVAPFNLLKYIVVSVLGYLAYLALRPVMGLIAPNRTK